MAKYSSDSDSERSGSKYRRKHTRRSSSLDSTDSSTSHQKRLKYSKIKRRYSSRSRSKDKSMKTYKYSRGSSRDRRRYRSQKSRSISGDRNRLRKRSGSREKSTSRSSSSQSNVKVLNSDKPSSTRDNYLMNDIKIKATILDDINNDEFIPKQFVSSTKAKEANMKNIVIDMNADTIHIPPIKNNFNTLNSIFHSSIMIDKEAKFDKWVKKLYSLRQKAVNELNCT